MTKLQKIFGAGPRGVTISIITLLLLLRMEKVLEAPSISSNESLRLIIFLATIALTLAIIVWSTLSLPPSKRGNELVTSGAFAYFRHPLYGAFLTFFNFGLAVYLNNYLYIFWAVLQHFIWHWNIKYEEQLMAEHFPGVYEEYSTRVSRFFPLKFLISGHPKKRDPKLRH